MATPGFNGKIFGIGLTKTGKSSLALALRRLGFRILDGPRDPRTIGEAEAGQLRFSILERCQGIVDTPVTPYYAQLDQLYPDSKFILTVRDREAWLRAVEAQWRCSEQWAAHHRHFRRARYFFHAAVYGTIDFEPNRYSYVYDLHYRNVCEHFKGRPEALLVFDICSGDGWEELCPFLGVPVPDEPLPRTEETQEWHNAQWWIEQLVAGQRDIERLIPEKGTIILVDEATLADTTFEAARHTIPFTEANGAYNGPPADSDSAISELNRHRRNGATHIVFAWPAFWWLEHYQGLHQKLQEQARCILRNDRLVIFELSPSRTVNHT